LIGRSDFQFAQSWAGKLCPLGLEPLFLWRARGRRRSSSAGCTDESLLFLEFGALAQNTSEGMSYHHFLARLAGFILVGRCYLAFGGLPESPSYSSCKCEENDGVGEDFFRRCSPMSVSSELERGVDEGGRIRSSGFRSFEFFFKNINTEM